MARAKDRSSRRGAAAVEFAVVAPLFFLLVFGFFDYSLYVYRTNIVQNAAREGARYAVSHARQELLQLDGVEYPNDLNYIINNVIRDSMNGVGLDNQQITLYVSDAAGNMTSPNHLDAEFGDWITCEISGDYRSVIGGILPDLTNIRVRSSMRSEAG